MQTRKLAFLAIMLALSIVLNLVERVAMGALTQTLGFLVAPLQATGGIRIGLANIVVMLLLYTYDKNSAFTVLILRIIFVGSVLGFGLTFFTALGGGVTAFFLMVIVKSMRSFTLISVSVVGALGHVFGQIFVAVVFFETVGIAVFVPFMMIVAVPAGIFTGKLTIKLLEYLKPMLNDSAMIKPE